MGKDEDSKEKKKAQPPVPGCWFTRFIAYLWYGWLNLLVIGPVEMFREIFHKPKKVDYSSLPKRTGEVAVLTGGTRGLGSHVLKKLLQLDFTVIIGARNIDAGMEAVEKIRNDRDGRGDRLISGTAKCFPLDLKSLQSVRSFAQKVLEEVDRIDLLVNNAGIMCVPWEVTEDHLESHFQVNYLSHFLLTVLLLPKMKETAARRGEEECEDDEKEDEDDVNKEEDAGKEEEYDEEEDDDDELDLKSKCGSPCRIVNVSSVSHYSAFGSGIQYSPYPKVYTPYKAYFESKLCQVISTKYLNKLLEQEGANVNVYAVHPGIIGTDLWNTLGCGAICFKWFAVKGLRSVDEGADEIMLPVISPSFRNEGGAYIQNSKKKKPAKCAEDEELQKQLWNMSMQLISKV